MRQLEARGGMYVEDGKIVLPSQNIKAMLADAAKVERKGSTVKKVVNILGESTFKFAGEPDPDKRAEQAEYVDERIVSLNPQTRTKGIRTRPIFDGWSAEGKLRFENTDLDEAALARFFELAGVIGLCERHGGFGQFDVEVLKKA